MFQVSASVIFNLNLYYLAVQNFTHKWQCYLSFFLWVKNSHQFHYLFNYASVSNAYVTVSIDNQKFPFFRPVVFSNNFWGVVEYTKVKYIA